MPKAGDIKVESGRYVIFDPSYGSNGDFRPATNKELQDAGQNLPENYLSIGQKVPEGKVRIKDPDTGVFVFADPPPDPNAPPPPKTPEQIAQEQFNQSILPFLDQQGNIREDLMGGDFNLTSQQLRDLQAQGNTTELNAALENLKGRQTARDTGFLGTFDDPTKVQAFLGSQGTLAGDVDAYGQQTAQGMQREIATNPQLIQGTFNEQQYLQANPDVAQAVARGDFASGKAHFDTFGKTEGRDMPTTGGTEFKPVLQQVKPEELMDPARYQVDPRGIQAPIATVQQTQTGTVAPRTQAATVAAATSLPQVQQQEITAATQTDLRDLVTAQEEQVAVQSTVQGQIASLTSQFDGGEIPSWAAPSIRLAEQRLAARGMGASSMAGASILQAAMEAATPIAAADAQTFARFQQANLNNRQQAEVLNAQQTLQLDLANLNNQQQANVLNSQQRVQAIFNDQAAVNSARQFNARNEQQNDQFFASMFNETSKFNAQQQNAIAQFNAGQTNTMEQFNATLENQREQFNTKNSILIDQSNTVWRRQINTQNTALQNAANQMNVMNRFNMSQTALNNMWQQFRDNEFWARTTARDNDQYAKKIAYASFIYNKNADAAFASKIGNLAFDVVSDLGTKFAPQIGEAFSDFFDFGGGSSDPFDFGTDSSDLGGNELDAGLTLTS